jgi:hypothetical protein
MKFELTADQISKYNAWVLEQNTKAVIKQKALVLPREEPFIHLYRECWAYNEPYYGAIGGSDTFSFTPTSIGMVVKVENSYTGDKLDLTKYEDW